MEIFWSTAIYSWHNIFNIVKNKDDCKDFVENIDYTFRNEDILENFRSLNKMYQIFDRDFTILLNK